jgi:tagaturonate epimerase
VQLEKYSFGVGDRFSLEGEAQLRAFIAAKADGVNIVPVWNKSNREHSIIGSSPQETYRAVQAAVKTMGWQDSYYIDADHIQIGNVDLFMNSCNFFTLDIAAFIGQSADEERIDDFLSKYSKYAGSLTIPGIDDVLYVNKDQLMAIAHKYLKAIHEAGSIYRHIQSIKGAGNFITEISIDETGEPQRPVELFFILAAIAEEGIPVQTIAPRFTGCFHKGVDYIGDIGQFTNQFEHDLAIIAFAINEFGLSENLKLSVHSGSDKFSLYKPINKALKKYNAGLHLKTAGTTWLEELTGFASAGGEGLSIVKRIYADAFTQFDELCAPYANVVDIDKSQLPSPAAVRDWSRDDFVNAVSHNSACAQYDANVRQLLHLAYKIAAEMKTEFTDALKQYHKFIGPAVTKNIYQKHIRPLFIEQD